MQKLVMALVLVVLLCGSTVVAEVLQPSPDHIGLYTEPDGSGKPQLRTSVPNEYVELYLLLIKPSAPAGVSHWECSVVFLPHNITAPSVTLAAGTDLETEDPWDFSVRIGTESPLPPAEVVHVLTISCYVDDPDGDPVYFYIDGSRQNSMGYTVPCYAAGDDPDDWRYLTQSSRAKWLPVFAINGNVTANDSATWGRLKNLYR